MRQGLLIALGLVLIMASSASEDLWIIASCGVIGCLTAFSTIFITPRE